LAVNGDIYVADPQAAMVFRFSSDGQLIESFGRPTSASFGDTTYKPMKVAVDNRRNMYILSEGVYNGIIQLSNAGEFLGYFTSNKVRLSFTQMLQDIFYTDEQKALLVRSCSDDIHQCVPRSKRHRLYNDHGNQFARFEET
jgi:hypothetical protein